MFLEKLEVFGFKSFGEKLEVRFAAGITGVIGPNGCGKTNICDALRWVLGEQNMRHLRGDVAEDVIFGGSASRKPLGMAEAVLTISNSDRVLPTEYDQVQVGRRIYRSGESHYLLNKQSVRLKDVRNLFFDTGMGSNAYSVIEREMVDNILAEGSHQRRFLFEEAAGITKYKARKHETLNKLYATDADLVRVNDLVAEIERQVGSLRYQAGKARRWQRLRQEIQALDLRLSAHAQAARVARVAELEAGLVESRTRLEGDVAALASAEAELETARLAVLDSEKALGAAQAEHTRLNAGLAELGSRLSVGQERARGLLAQLQQGEADQVRLAGELARMEEERERLRAEETQLSAALAEREAHLEREEGALAAAEDALREKRTGLSEQRQRSLDLVQQTMHRRAELEQLQAYLGRCEEQLRQAAEQERALAERLAGIAAREEAARAALEARQAELGESRRRESELEAEARALGERVAERQARERDLRERAAAAESRRSTLQELKDSFEGFEAGVRALFQDHRAGGLRGVVVDMLDVPREWVDALEVFLGPVLQAVVVDSDEAAYRGRDRLLDGERGRATFVPLTRLARHAPAALPPDIADAAGVLGYAPGVVRAKAGFEALAELLLGSVVLVEDAATARRLSARHAAGPWGFLTRSGEFWGPHRLHLGAGPSGTRILHREHEIRDLTAEAAALASELAGVRREREAEEAGLAACQAGLAGARQARAAAEEGSLEAERQVNRVLTERRLAESERDGSSAQAAKLRQEREAIAAELSQAESELAERARLSEQAAEGQSALERELATLEERREACRTEAGALKLEWTRVHTRRGELEARRAELERNLEASRTALQGRGEEAAARLQERTALLEELRGLAERHAAGGREMETRTAGLRELEGAHLEARSEEALAAAQAKELRQAAEAGREGVHAAELELHDLRAALEQELARLKVEYELEDLGALSQQAPPGEGDTAEKLHAMKARLRGLGPVNPLAMDEYVKHKERYDFLTTQRDDLVEARKQLLEVIDKINATASGLFAQTFERAREKFREVFQTMFEGGEADLVLTGDDPLEADIDIVARPRGKRLQAISLLSSGERALTAISLLFGLYLVKPSPFCILDEVDAPLDDANIDRFVALLRHFSRNTQFVVITHNKRTMEVCDVLYGVTMQEPGCSRMISVSFEKAAGDGNGNGSGAQAAAPATEGSDPDPQPALA
ncbi:MAG TPA: chromosome segregation protein SMC [Candidatus Saccharimonadales bacterium]|nr:chromosome segregation protein SMC [Candidatus Saccharimonadales bacterium]